MTHPAWQRLGIAPTDDGDVIRRAYSRQLKAIDVDADPAGFIALREAFELARYLGAEADEADAAPYDEAEIDDPAEIVPFPAAAPATPEPQDLEARPQWVEDVEAVQALVFGEASREAIFAEVGERTARVIASPEMESVDHAARIERWAADVILSGIPRSNGLLAPAINGFGWLKRAEQWDCPPLIGAVLDRYNDCQFTAKIGELNGPLNTAFRLLRDPGTAPHGKHAEAVEQFLRIVRMQHPTVLQELSPEAVDAWEGLLERRYNAPLARAVRKWDAFCAAVGRIGRRLYLPDIFRILGIGVLWIIGIGVVISTHGIALIFLLPALLNRDRA